MCANPGQRSPNSGRCRSTSPKFGQTRPNISFRFTRDPRPGQILAKSGELRSKTLYFGRRRPEFGPNSAAITICWPNPGLCCPKSGDLRPKAGLQSVESAHILCRNRAELLPKVAGQSSRRVRPKGGHKTSSGIPAVQRKNAVFLLLTVAATQVVDKLLREDSEQFRPKVAELDQCWPIAAKIWQISPKLTKCRLLSAMFGRVFVKVRPASANFDQRWPKLGNSGRSVIKVGQCRPFVGATRQMLVEICRMLASWANLALFCRKCGQHRPILGRIWAESRLPKQLSTTVGPAMVTKRQPSDDGIRWKRRNSQCADLSQRRSGLNSGTRRVTTFGQLPSDMNLSAIVNVSKATGITCV